MYSEKYLREKFENGLSLIAKDGNEIVGVTLGYVPPLDKKVGNISPKLKPLQVIRSKHFERMKELFPNEKCVFFNHIALLKCYQGNGFGFHFIKQ